MLIIICSSVTSCRKPNAHCATAPDDTCGGSISFHQFQPWYDGLTIIVYASNLRRMTLQVTLILVSAKIAPVCHCVVPVYVCVYHDLIMWGHVTSNTLFSQFSFSERLFPEKNKPSLTDSMSEQRLHHQRRPYWPSVSLSCKLTGLMQSNCSTVYLFKARFNCRESTAIHLELTVHRWIHSGEKLNVLFVADDLLLHTHVTL